jgi:hypothetical protein
MASAVAKRRHFSELRSALPILIAIGLKESPETSELEEFQLGLPAIGLGRRATDSQETTAEMLKRQMYGRAGIELLRARLLPKPAFSYP